jgi:hypothetical protein
MPRPTRTDSFRKITLSLSAVCHEQAAEVIQLLLREPNRRYAPTVSEVVERAVALLHAEMTKPASPRAR